VLRPGRKPPDDSASEPEASTGAASPPRFPRPKILAIDLKTEDVELLSEAGYNVRVGTFGQPLQVPAAPGRFQHLQPQASLPNYTEQEVIIADLAPPAAADETAAASGPPPQETSIWVDTGDGVIDPRPRVMSLVQEKFDRIHRHGGVFILLADMRHDPGYVFARPAGMYGGTVEVQHEVPIDNWGCLSLLDTLEVSGDQGVELEPGATEAAQAFALTRHLKDAHFSCLVKPGPRISERWITLATSKYGDPVAGIIAPSEPGEGWVIILPRIAAPGQLTRELLDEVLPNLTPRLFPDSEGNRWTRREEYELPAVLDIGAEIRQVEEESRERINALEAAIELQRTQSGFLHDLLTGTGDTLVDAVVAAVELLGFTDVRNVDALTEGSQQQERAERLREDLQIWDCGPVLLVEIKGIGGLPREAESLQVTKYLIPRMREWERTDVQGLSVINHQRNLPALDREHEHVFQDDVVTNAEQQGFGLLTTWDLFRLVRGYQRNGWRREDVKDLFHRAGRIEPVPSHYEFVGTVEAFWERPGALALAVSGVPVRVGDLVAYELPVDFLEERITSLQLEDEEVQEAPVGSLVGVKTTLGKAQARMHVRVFRVREEGAQEGDEGGGSEG
jgi:hypothetical protein